MLVKMCECTQYNMGGYNNANGPHDARPMLDNYTTSCRRISPNTRADTTSQFMNQNQMPGI